MVIGDRPAKPASKTGVAVKAGAGVRMAFRVPDTKAACEYARRIVGKTFDPEEAPKLPLAGCGLIECRCRFERVTDQRGKVRREKDERRDMIRFETKDNRRNTSDRRKTNTRWTGPR